MEEITYGPTLKISEYLHSTKYRGTGESFTSAMDRISANLSDDEEHRKALKDILINMRFLPAGRVQSSIGSPHQTTAFNCFVVEEIEDSMRGIMECFTNAALTMRQGGGIGYDFSTIRPKGSNIVSLNSPASGPVSFMHIGDSVCATVSSAGNRRGAQMGVLRVDHPDIEEFITAKHNETDLTHYNISVGITDEFMHSLDTGEPFALRWKGEVVRFVDAQALWDLMMRSTWEWAEPGILFIDRINKWNNLWYCEKIAATNPCVSGDTLILTSEGYKQIDNLEGKSVSVWNGETFSSTQIRQTGTNMPMKDISFSDGSHLSCTYGHGFYLRNGTKVEASQLQVGDKLLKHSWPIIDSSNIKLEDAYTQGFSKTKVPSVDIRLKDRKLWLRGIMDSDGHVTKEGNAQISSKNRKFLEDIKLLLNTMGATGTLSPMREHWRLTIPASYYYYLNIDCRHGRVKPSREARRFVTVSDIQEGSVCKKVYCFTEPKRGMGIFNGVLTAQCGEVPLPPNGACLLGSFNLVKYVNDGKFNWKQFKEDIPVITRAMDNVIDRTTYPLLEQEKEAKKKRRIGIGITGTANALEYLGHAYASNEYIEKQTKVLQTLQRHSYLASVELAKEKGSFPLFDKDKHLSGNFIKSLPQDIRKAIRENGIRNSHLLSIAPTGTISLTADNVSSGIEPVFSYGYERTIQTEDGPIVEFVEDYGHRVFGVKGKTSDQVPVKDHVRVLVEAQKYIDAACSKTCNVGDDVTWEEFKNIYRIAYQQGAKGVTTFRSAGKRYGILNTKKEETESTGEACFIDSQTGNKECS